MNSITVSTDVNRLMGRAILDETFRHKLFADPKAAIREAGLTLYDAEIAHLEATLHKLKTNQTTEQLNHQFQEYLPRGSWH